jgi:hypothetical protein
MAAHNHAPHPRSPRVQALHSHDRACCMTATAISFLPLHLHRHCPRTALPFPPTTPWTTMSPRQAPRSASRQRKTTRRAGGGTGHNRGQRWTPPPVGHVPSPRIAATKTAPPATPIHGLWSTAPTVQTTLRHPSTAALPPPPPLPPLSPAPATSFLRPDTTPRPLTAPSRYPHPHVPPHLPSPQHPPTPASHLHPVPPANLSRPNGPQGTKAPDVAMCQGVV